MYAIIELQTTNGQMAHLFQSAETYEEAMSKYHQVLAAAALSKVEYHACVVLNVSGVAIARESYERTQQEEVVEE